VTRRRVIASILMGGLDVGSMIRKASLIVL
jgi:hypothetical protein